MNYMDYIFYLFSSLLIVSSFRVISSSNPVHSALSLVLAFFSASGLWLLLHAEFLAIALVLVYVGAVMVLFLFVVMMIDIDVKELKKGFWNYFPLAILVISIFIFEVYLVVSNKIFQLSKPIIIEEFSNTENLGKVLYTKYLLPFEIAAVILLVAIISAIALTMQGKKRHKGIDPAIQVNVKKQDRVRIIKMKSEKK
ncbi:MAG: NADH-quinone oxidoreductase subunit J [Nitrosomonadales bacterium]|jgi:NADH-quinone oxidoreductase subunit J